jgi:hypothetical protein
MASNDTNQRSVADDPLFPISSQKLSELSSIEHPVVSSQLSAGDLPKSLVTTTAALTVSLPLDLSKVTSLSTHNTDFGFLPIPPQCRYNPDRPHDLPHWKTAVFALASTFSMSPHCILKLYSDLIASSLQLVRSFA